MQYSRRKTGQNRHDRPGRQVYTIGIPVLLVTFVAVCLIVLSAAAYVTSRQDLKEARNHVEVQAEYQKAMNRAEEVCMEIDQGKNPSQWNGGDRISVGMKDGGTLTAGVEERNGRHVISWTQVKKGEGWSGKEQNQEINSEFPGPSHLKKMWRSYLFISKCSTFPALSGTVTLKDFSG